MLIKHSEAGQHRSGQRQTEDMAVPYTCALCLGMYFCKALGRSVLALSTDTTRFSGRALQM